MIDIEFRGITDEDYSYILSSWVKSIKARISNDVDKESYVSSYHDFVKKKLAEEKVIIACDPKDSEFILGYIVYNDNVIHYSYVRYSLRRQKICSTLIEKIGMNIEYISNIPLWWNKSNKIKNTYKYNPLLLYLKQGET